MKTTLDTYKAALQNTARIKRQVETMTTSGMSSDEAHDYVLAANIEEAPNNDPNKWVDHIDKTATYVLLSEIERLSPEKRTFGRTFFSRRAAGYGLSIAEVLREVCPVDVSVEESRSWSTVLMNKAAHVALWHNYGRHHYTLSDGLATQLALTELRGLRSEDLRLPYTSVFVEIPPHLGFKVLGTSKVGERLEPVEGVFITEDDNDGTMPGLVYLPDENPDQEVNARLQFNPGRSWRILIVSRPFSISDVVGSEGNPYDTAQSYFRLSLREGESVDDEIARITSGTISLNGAETVLPLWRWLVNVLMYATTPDAEVDAIRANPEADGLWRRIEKLPKVSAKRDRLKERLRGLDPQHRTHLGKSVAFTPALRKMYDDHREGGGTKLRVRTLVAGHWQRFATGKGRVDRVWKFRAPFWRGPEDAPIAEETEHRMAGRG
jgi:hypothetical protein